MYELIQLFDDLGTAFFAAGNDCGDAGQASLFTVTHCQTLHIVAPPR